MPWKYNGTTLKVGQEFTGTIDISLVTSYTLAADAGQYSGNMTYDEDNNFVYVQYPRNGGGVRSSSYVTTSTIRVEQGYTSTFGSAETKEDK